jgi:hypothetical protein
MRYNLESMLPLGAFEHCGDRRIKLYGGGGSWNPVNIVEDAFSSVGDAVSDVVEGAGNVLAEVDDFVNDEIPGGWVLPAAVAVAVTTGYVDPTMFGAEAAFTGATETGLATLAGEGAIADAVGTTLLAGGAETGGGMLTSLGLGAEAAAPFTAAPGLDPGLFTLAEGIAPEFSFVNPEFMGPTYSELGYTGLETGQMGPTYGELGYTGYEEFVPAYPGDAQYIEQDMMQQARSTDVPSGSPTSWDRGDSLIPKELTDAARAARAGYNLYNAFTASPVARLSRGYLPQASISESGGAGGGSGSVVGALPGSLKETSLAAAPVIQGTNMNLNQLKQLYPQLSNVDPRILNMLTGRQVSTPNYFTYGGDQSGAGGTGFTSTAQGGLPTAGYPSIASDRLNQTRLEGSSSLAGFNPLSTAGLRTISSGALPGMPTYGLKEGGNVHIPEFKTGTTGHFVEGKGDGQSDDIPAMLADGEYVFDADTVAALGNGSSKAGALQLDKMREAIRKHKRSAPHDKIPPKAKSPLEYLKG